MKIAVAVDKKGNLNNNIAEHFGQAKYFLIYDDDLEKFIIELNPEFLGKLELPPDFLHRFKINVVITFGLGPKAYEKFKKYKIKMFKATPGAISKNIRLLNTGKLKKLAGEDIF